MVWPSTTRRVMICDGAKEGAKSKVPACLPSCSYVISRSACMNGLPTVSLTRLHIPFGLGSNVRAGWPSHREQALRQEITFTIYPFNNKGATDVWPRRVPSPHAPTQTAWPFCERVVPPPSHASLFHQPAAPIRLQHLGAWHDECITSQFARCKW